MILELAQSPLARRLAVVNEAVAGLLERIAEAGEGAGFEAATAAWPYPGPSRNAVEAVLALPAGERRRLYEAVRADHGFEQSLEREHFRFSFPELAPDTRRAGGKLLRSMYDTFGGKGFELGPGEVIRRASWELAFRDANPDVGVCPACLANQLEQPIRGRSAVDADHYLPKKHYPQLAVHSLNLVPLCQGCNRTAKGELDPLGNGEAAQSLTSIWFPYRRPGIHELEVHFEVDTELGQMVKLGAKPACERRVRNFDDLFDISSRWSASLGSIHNRVVRSLRRRCKPPNRATVKAALLDIEAEEAEGVPGSPHALLTSRYCGWLAADEHALEKVLKEVDPP